MIYNLTASLCSVQSMQIASLRWASSSRASLVLPCRLLVRPTPFPVADDSFCNKLHVMRVTFSCRKGAGGHCARSCSTWRCHLARDKRTRHTVNGETETMTSLNDEQRDRVSCFTLNPLPCAWFAAPPDFTLSGAHMFQHAGAARVQEPGDHDRQA